MKFTSMLLALTLGSLALTQATNPFVKAATGNIKCIIDVMDDLPTLSQDPVSAFMQFSACAGEQTWDLMAPFLGGFIRIAVTSINPVTAVTPSVPPVAADY